MHPGGSLSDPISWIPQRACYKLDELGMQTRIPLPWKIFNMQHHLPLVIRCHHIHSWGPLGGILSYGPVGISGGVCCGIHQSPGFKGRLSHNLSSIGSVYKKYLKGQTLELFSLTETWRINAT